MLQKMLPIILLAFALACGEIEESGSSGLVAVLDVDVTGTWTGTWTGSNGSGAFELVLDQTKLGVAGTATFTGFVDGPDACPSTGNFTGTREGTSISNVVYLSAPRDPVGIGTPVITYAHVMSGALDVLANRMVGDYTLTFSDPIDDVTTQPCHAFTGTLDLTLATP